MLKPFTLHIPNTIAQCLDLLWQHDDAKVLAGGTDVFVQMHKGESYPILVDLKKIQKLRALSFSSSEGLCIGASVTHRELIRDENARKYYPALIDAISKLGSVQVRNRGTVAGNICNASPAADTAVPLLLYDAVVHVMSKENAERDVAIADFFTGPKQTCLHKSEIVTQIRLAPPSIGSGSGYVKLMKRGAMEIGIMGAGVKIATDAAGKCTFARVALSAVNPTPVRVKEAEDFITGKELTAENIAGVTRLAYEKAAPKTWRNSEEWSKDMVRIYIPQAMQIARYRMGKGEF